MIGSVARHQTLSQQRHGDLEHALGIRDITTGWVRRDPGSARKQVVDVARDSVASPEHATALPDRAARRPLGVLGRHPGQEPGGQGGRRGSCGLRREGGEDADRVTVAAWPYPGEAFDARFVGDTIVVRGPDGAQAVYPPAFYALD